MEVKVLLVKAFTNSINDGNPAGVVIHHGDLDESQMQQLAAIVNFSETAFVQKIKDAEYEVRFFTPKVETNLCGHATIATFTCIRNHDALQGEVTMKTKAGILQVVVNEHSIFMEQAAPQYLPYDLDEDELFEALNIPQDYRRDELPIRIISTGTPKILIPIKNRACLFEITPKFEKLIEISKKTESKGFYAFTFDPIHQEHLVHTRQFNPLFGVNEDPITGVAAGALGIYLKEEWNPNLKEFVIEQGWIMDKKGLIHVRLEDGKVFIGGNGVIYDEQVVEI